MRAFCCCTEQGRGEQQQVSAHLCVPMLPKSHNIDNRACPTVAGGSLQPHLSSAASLLWVRFESQLQRQGWVISVSFKPERCILISLIYYLIQHISCRLCSFPSSMV